MAGRVAGKIKLQTVDELLGVPEIAGTQEIELGRIHAFPNHPFKVLDDERMDMLVESIRENGILNPVIVRPDKNGDYAFLLHIIASLNSTGKGAVILPHGVLFRGNAEAEIRKNIIDRKLIKGITCLICIRFVISNNFYEIIIILRHI